VTIPTPWNPRKTRQVEGRDSEKKQARRHGVRLHPNSGAGKIKDDASDEDRLVEFKDANISHTLNANDLDVLFRRAVAQGKEAQYIILFANDLEATITLRRVRK
jgi:hypothetical protein